MIYFKLIGLVVILVANQQSLEQDRSG